MGVLSGVPTPRTVQGRPWVILLVDDEPDILSSLRTMIEHAMPGTKVITANGGRRALDILAETPVDALVADFKMPSMDGIELLYLARKSHPKVPRIMLTAYADDDLVRRAFTDAFVDEFIPKMLDPGEFLDRIGRFLTVARLEPSQAPLLPMPVPRPKPTPPGVAN